MIQPFSQRLTDAVRNRKTPLVVGLDPRWDRIPEPLKPDHSVDDSWSHRADAYERFCRGVIDVVHHLVPAVKPQAAFFEQLGPAGMQALAAVVAYARQQGLLVIMDAKRGDIGSTAESYARAFLGSTPDSAWGCDALTVNPYLGEDSLSPFVERAVETGSGLFVLVKTSNPGSGTLQDLVIADGQSVYQATADWIERLAAETAGQDGYGAVGAVVGATYPEQLAELRSRMPHSWLLIPGLGAQGGTAADVAAGFDQHGLGAVVNSSRAIIFANQSPRYEQLDWQQAIEQATRDTIAALADETPAGKL